MILIMNGRLSTSTRDDQESLRIIYKIPIVILLALKKRGGMPVFCKTIFFTIKCAIHFND